MSVTNTLAYYIVDGEKYFTTLTGGQKIFMSRVDP